MTMRVTMRDPRRSEDGLSILVTGQTYTVSDDYGRYLVSQGAIDTDNAIATEAAANRDQLLTSEVRATRAVVSKYGDYPALTDIGGVVAFWDFKEPRAPFASKAGRGGPLSLRQGPGSRVTKSNGGPLGHSVVFNGTSDYLYVDAADIGALNIGAGTGNVFVLAFIKRQTTSPANCIAGIWQETNSNPRRQYALFTNLGVYGGQSRACFHISKTGDKSPGLPYSRDIAKNRWEELTVGQWTCISGGYDGAAAYAYVEGRLELWPSYTEPGAPDGDGRTYAANPYAFTLGMNSTAAPFTVGACEVAGSMANFYSGELAALLVMDRMPSKSEIRAIQATINESAGGFRHRLRHVGSPALAGVQQVFGAAAYVGTGATDSTAAGTGWIFTAAGSESYIIRTNTTSAGPALVIGTEVPEGITTDSLASMSMTFANANTGDTVRMCVRIGSAWYATEATYAVTAASASGSDWSLAEEKTNTFNAAGANWRDLTVTPGTALTLAGAARGSPLPSGAITAWGVYSPSVPTGSVRFRDVVLRTL